MQSYNHIEPEWPDFINPEDEVAEPVQFIVENYCARGLVTVIGGAGGSGKSLFNQFLLQRRSNEILDTKESGFALYITGADTSKIELIRRTHAIGGNRGLIGVELPGNTMPFINDVKFFASLIRKIEEFRHIDVVVFDTLADFHHGNLIDATDANDTMQAFRSFASHVNVAVIIITHTRKGSKVKIRYDVEDISDSRVFTTKADLVFGLKSEYKGENYNLIELQCLKNRVSKPMSYLRMEIFEDVDSGRLEISKTSELFSYELEDQRKAKEMNELVQECKKLSQEGMSYRDIADKFDISKSSVGRYINME